MNNQLPHVVVLLSSYNGEAYIQEQIDSILDQNDVRITIYVRDDGSTDGTLEILNRYVAENKLILLSEQNIGVAGSFFRLLEVSGDAFDFYAFADQDDVWKSDKLYNACIKLSDDAATTAGMYYSRLEFVDKNLHHLGYSIIPTTKGFHNALVQNQATGCTVVLNKKARNLISGHIPPWTLMHDWWCYLVISAFGTVIYDEKPSILYRKHGSNVTPATPNFMLELYARTRRFMGNGAIAKKVSDQARLFYTLYGDRLNSEQISLIQGFLNTRQKGLLGRTRYAIMMPVRRNTPIDNLIMRILFIIGRF
jgi:glycosyltransferase involved in cell wall biosynthesis